MHIERLKKGFDKYEKNEYNFKWSVIGLMR